MLNPGGGVAQIALPLNFEEIPVFEVKMNRSSSSKRSCLLIPLFVMSKKIDDRIVLWRPFLRYAI